jgi:hypothetical protein
MAKNDQGLTERQDYWLGHIKACEASGKTAAEYAAAHGLNARTLYGAKKVLVRKGVLPRTHGVRFQRVQTASAVAVGGEWRIQLPNGVAVDFSGAVDGGTLSTVLHAVAKLG